MPTFTVTDLGQHGVIVDVPPNELPDNAWSGSRNVRFQSGSVRLFPGDTEVSKCDIDQRTYALQPLSTPSAYWWVQAGIKAAAPHVCAYDGSENREVTPVGMVVDPHDQWSGGVFNGVSILHNGRTPYYWPDPNTPATRYLDLPYNDTDTWATAGLAAKVLRPYKNVLFALDVTQGGARLPHLVKWSSAADPGYVPASWEKDDPTNIAGESAALAEKPGFLVDMATLGDQGIIYKEDSVWTVNITQSTFVMKFREAIQTVGALSPNCIADLKDRHVVMGDGDIIQHNGQSASSVVERRIRDHIFRNLDTNYYRSSFIVNHHLKNEVWVCFPTGGQQQPNQAAVWDLDDDNWTIRDLPEDTTFMVTGVQFPPFNAPAVEAWDIQTDKWDDYFGRKWGQRSFNPVVRTLVGTSEYGISQYEDGLLIGGKTPDVYVERIGLPVGGHDNYTTVRRIYPDISGSGIVNFFVGVHDKVSDNPVWYGPYPFEIGVDAFFPDKRSSLRANGRLHALRLQGTASLKDLDWRGYKADYNNTGRV